MKIPKYGEDGLLALVEWYDARGINSQCQLLLSRKTPNEIMRGLIKVTVGFVSRDKDTLVIAQELEVEDGKSEIHDITLIPTQWVKAIYELEKVKARRVCL